jgi:hypothetical protein|tara:strand:- start:99 stop:392 length:294 start_codon:yes stop_codon:yes gene_type:complete
MVDKAGPKQYSKRQTQQPRKAKINDNFFEKHGKKIEKYGDTAVNTLVGGIGVAAGFAANELRKLNKFQNEQRGLRNKAHMERFLKAKRSRKPDMIVD